MPNLSAVYASGETAVVGDIVEFYKNSKRYRRIIALTKLDRDECGLKAGHPGVRYIICDVHGVADGNEPTQESFLAYSDAYYLVKRVEHNELVELLSKEESRRLVVILNVEGQVVYPLSMAGLPKRRCIGAADFVFDYDGSCIKSRAIALSPKRLNQQSQP